MVIGRSLRWLGSRGGFLMNRIHRDMSLFGVQLRELNCNGSRQ